MDQNDYEMRFVILTQNILMDPEINATDKIILARITGFEQFFESPATTADLLGISELIVKRSKRKLAKLGYIKEISDTGRGKIYQANLWKIQSRCCKNVTSDVTKMSHQMLQNCHIENKERIKKDKSEYGREDLNELLALWESETGIQIKSEQNQRRQMFNLSRKYGIDETKRIIQLVGKSIKSNDRFAPAITKPSDLTGRFEKLSKLQLWENRNKAARSFGMTPAPAMAIYSIKKKPVIQEEISDQERERVSEMFKEARSKILGAKYQSEDQGKNECNTKK